MTSGSSHASMVFAELGAILLGLALLARLANRFGFSTIPLYLITGLALGNGGLFPVQFSEEFVGVGAEIGVLLLLFMLGLEYTGEELRRNLVEHFPSGALDFILNFPIGFIAGLFLGWDVLSSLLLAGVTYISSSGIIAKVLTDFGHLSKPETRSVLSILVLEDLVMAVYLPIVAVLLIGQEFSAGVLSVCIALSTVTVVLFTALKYGDRISEQLTSESDEVLLLTTLGVVLLVAGIAQAFHVSAAVGAFLVGITLSGPIVHQAHRLLGPLRDLFAAEFFFFFGLQISPASLIPVLPSAALLALLTAGTKVLTGWLASRNATSNYYSRLRAGTALVARGEFSIVIAGLGVAAGKNSSLGSFAAAYVLILAILGPVLLRLVDLWSNSALNGPISTE